MSILAQADRARGKCPLCGQVAAAAFKPFCGQGCRDRDLLNWLGDAYRVPGPPAEQELAENLAGGVDSRQRPPL
jgi:uncharacterized protein